MIYLIYGNDNSQKTSEVKKIATSGNVVRIQGGQITQNAILSFASQVQLFGESPVIVIENIILENENILDKDVLSAMQNSQNTFILSEDKLTQVVVKKYKKHLKESILCEKKESTKPKSNSFIIADKYAKRDKVGTWASYIELINQGESPEAVSGILFWKIKTMILSNSTRPYSQDELAKSSANLVDIYHKSHRGEIDMRIALEKFILSTV